MTTNARSKPLPPQTDPWTRGPFGLAAFLTLLLLILAFKIYKSHHTGIIYDEAFTAQRFARDLHQALTDFSSPNNHFLNSVFVCGARSLFASYEHYPRLPSLLAGLLFTLASAWLLLRTLHSWLLRIPGLALLNLVPYVFDYSYLARGYAFALAAVLLQLALLAHWLHRPLPFRRAWRPILLLALLNFLALGAMMTSVLVLAAFNLLLVLAFSTALYRDAPRPLKVILLHALALLIATALPTWLLYRRVLKSIPAEIAQECGPAGRQFLPYLRDLFLRIPFPYHDRLGALILAALVVLLLLAVALTARPAWRQCFPAPARRFALPRSPRAFLLLFVASTLLVLFVYSVLLRRPLGFPRSQVCLIPPFLLALLILLDALIAAVPAPLPRRLAELAVALALAAAVLHDLPDPHVAIGGQSISGQLVRRLRTLDPARTWVLAFSPAAVNFQMPIQYYQAFGYKIAPAQSAACDLYLCTFDQRPDRGVFLDYHFCRRFGCAVVFNGAPPLDRLVLEAVLK